jgi:hypothetical protein
MQLNDIDDKIQDHFHRIPNIDKENQMDQGRIVEGLRST